MKKHEIALLIGLIAATFFTSVQTFANQVEELREGMLRLHILANSDQEEDQRLKLAVRDAVLLGTEDLFTACGSKEEVIRQAGENLELIRSIAQEEVIRQGCGYPVRAEVVNMFFDTRQYGDITVAAGRYDAVRITIGEGQGKNWWCVLFPPMCVPAATAESVPLERQIADIGQPPQYKAKFAVVEMVESLNEWLNGDDAQ